MLNDPILIGKLKLANRLVMPPMQTGHSCRGHVTDAMVDYYRERAREARPGLIITEHSCISEAGRADAGQLSIASDEMIPELRRITDAIHEYGCRVFTQLNHAGSAAEPFDEGEIVSAGDLGNPRKKLDRKPRPLNREEISELEKCFAEAAFRAAAAGYDGIEIHSAHGYLLNQFYSPLTNPRTDEYGPESLESRTRFLRETVVRVRDAVGPDLPIAVRLGGADYMPGGATEEDAADACVLLAEAGVDLLDISGGMCGFVRAGHQEAGYFASMTQKIKEATEIPVLLTGGVTTAGQAEMLLQAGMADLIGVGRALFRNPKFEH